MLNTLEKVSRAALPWCAVLVGCSIVAMALTDLYMLAAGAEPGTPIYLDELAPTRPEALLQLAYGLTLVIGQFLLRSATRRRKK
jgi:hypothetical protein